MEDKFQFEANPRPPLAADEAYINGACEGLSFTSLLTCGSDAPPYNFFPETTPYSQPQKPRSETAASQERPSDKTRRLKKLLPWGDKADMATVLEEAHNYITFLHAQVSVLRSMPRRTATTHGGGGDLRRLSRRQLLEVAVISPEAQTRLYSNGCCVYSAEQVVFLKRKAIIG